MNQDVQALAPNQKNDPVDIGIIIVVYNLHEACLSSLAIAIKNCRYSTRVAIIDNDSPFSHLVQEWAARHLPEATVVMRGHNHGFGRSMNFGADLIDARYYFLLNPDTNITDPDLLNKFVSTMEARPEIGILAPKITNFDGSRQDTCRRFPRWYQPLVQRTFLSKTKWGKKYLEYFLMHDFDQASEREVDWVQGSALFLSSELWKQLGGFDHRYWLYFEDIDLCRRVWQSGHPVVYNPDMSLQHAYGRASAKIKNPVLNILKTKATRAHIVSWMKYMWKWKFVRTPRIDENV